MFRRRGFALHGSAGRHFFVVPARRQGYDSVMVQTRDDIVSLLRQTKADLCRRYPIRRIALFGSWARGDQTTASDVDILVNLEPGRSLMDLGGLLYDLQNLFDAKVDVVTENGLRPRIREHVLHEAIPL